MGGAAIFDLWMTAELLLSGRLVPLPLMPDWVQTLSWFLPFQWAFFYPIDVLVGDMSNAELARGLGFQLFWTQPLLAPSMTWRSVHVAPPSPEAWTKK